MASLPFDLNTAPLLAQATSLRLAAAPTSWHIWALDTPPVTALCPRLLNAGYGVAGQALRGGMPARAQHVSPWFGDKNVFAADLIGRLSEGHTFGEGGLASQEEG